MKRGFLLSSGDQQAAGQTEPESVVLQAVEADDCPICLEELEPSTSIMLHCRHQICIECTRQCWSLRRQAQPATQHLECPLCRSLITVLNANLSAFIAAHTASNFQSTTSSQSPPKPHAAVGAKSAQPGTLAHNLTLQELKMVIRLLSLQGSLAGACERHDIESIVEQRIRAPAPEQAVDSLPSEVLRGLLRGRCVPYANISGDHSKLADLVRRSPRGACQALPVGVLRTMLREFGHAAEAFDDLEKADLARRVAAARALHRSTERLAARGAQAQRRMMVQADEQAVPQPGCGGCCTIC